MGEAGGLFAIYLLGCVVTIFLLGRMDRASGRSDLLINSAMTLAWPLLLLIFPFYLAYRLGKDRNPKS